MDGASPQLLNTARTYNIPICVAQMGMGLFGWGPDLERQEHSMANMCMGMAKTVHVDSIKRYIFIGETPSIPDTGLIEYIDEIKSSSSNSFFSQWDLLKSLLMEFSVIGLQQEPLFCIKGLWVIDKWARLEVFHKSSITVVPPQEGPIK